MQLPKQYKIDIITEHHLDSVDEALEHELNERLEGAPLKLQSIQDSHPSLNYENESENVFDNDLTTKSLMDEHPSWFENDIRGQAHSSNRAARRASKDSSYTKEKAMNGFLKERFKNIYSKLRKRVLRESQYCCLIARKTLDEISELKSENIQLGTYSYFDRQSKVRLCDEIGNFVCQPMQIGEENRDAWMCPDYHFINPYRSKTDKIVFQKEWEFDHLIPMNEGLNSISKSLIRVIGDCYYNEDIEVNVDYFVSLLFELVNLTFVRKGKCHPRGERFTFWFIFHHGIILLGHLGIHNYVTV